MSEEREPPVLCWRRCLPPLGNLRLLVPRPLVDAAQVVWNSADPAAVRVASVSARFSIAVVDQQEGGHDLRQAEEAPLTFTRAAAAHCWEQLASRADLRAPGTGRLLHDRLLLRADITVDSIDSDSSEKESSSSEEESSSSSGSDGGMKE